VQLALLVPIYDSLSIVLFVGRLILLGETLEPRPARVNLCYDVSFVII
jgi:hypothetical protein